MKIKTGLFTQLSELISFQLKRITTLAQLAQLEAKLAGKSFMQLMLMMYLIGFSLLSTWISLQFIIYLCLTALHFATLTAAGIIFMLNLSILITLLLLISRAKHNLTFPATRKQIALVNPLRK